MKSPINIFAGIVLVTVALSGCDRLILDDVPSETHEDIFEIIWTDLDRNYSYFPLKDIDWDSVYTVFKPRIERTGTQDELFIELSDMLDLLRDTHVNLYISRNRFYSYLNSSTYPKYPKNFYPEIVEASYLESSTTFGPYLYGRVRGENIGYIRISSFGAPESQYKTITAILDQYRSAEGLIIDLRDNPGGSDTMSDYIAGLFTDRKVPYALVRWKKGPGHNEFTEWETKFIAPTLQSSYAKPVVLLTNRSCGSSTEDFILAMDQLPRVEIVGDTTSGGSGNPVHRELPNGWTYRFSRWQIVTLQKTYFEGTGLIPDHAVWISPADSSASRDSILDRAILRLKNGS